MTEPVAAVRVEKRRIDPVTCGAIEHLEMGAPVAAIAIDEPIGTLGAAVPQLFSV